ncbi:MAG: family 78 glycoside hydrolase catalytic domain [Kiritimatiellae bacterium]|nr:family 78 glycoside hydrolase catalytic domain [Kiritimatiellia bacterium]MDD5522387.1 family 78 glycoside hydrolase catalytic domain [Kiritimatiellia bacterium]
MKNIFRLMTVWVFMSLGISQAGMVVEDLKCEYLSFPVGIDVQSPRLSWVLRMDERTTRLEGRGQKQTAYRILAASSELLLRNGKGDLWDSGKIESSQNIHVRYQGKPLRSCQLCFWKVQVFDKDGKPSEWSKPATFEMGLLDQSDWLPAEWIGLAGDNRQSSFSMRYVKTSSMKGPQGETSFPSPLFRKEFETTIKISSARAYICGLGYYELYINGNRIGKQVLDPGQTTYDVRALYAVHDVTAYVNPGKNAVGVWLGNGFYGQNVAFAAKGLAWGPPTVICKIVIDYNDGTSKTIVTDESWKANISPVVFDNVYAGETYDARRERPRWNFPGYDDFNWPRAVKVTVPCERLSAQTVPPIKQVKKIKPRQIIAANDEKWIFDFEQNIAGWVKIRINESPGTQVTLRFAEGLTPDGEELDVSTLGTDATGVDQTCIYICKGSGWETWEPRFVYHSFRYVEVGGLARKPSTDIMEGIHVRTSFESRGGFSCSDEQLNRIYQASLGTIEDSLHSIPADCPHREKSAWLGDVHSVVETSIFNFDMAQFWNKFIDDIEAILGGEGETNKQQKITTGAPCNIAVGRRLYQEARPDWSAAVVLIPWYLYLYYEDTDIIARYYERMKQFVDYVGGLARDHIVYQGYGDWCPPGENTGIECPVGLSSTAYHYRTLVIMERFAGILNKTDDAGKFWEEGQKTKDAFNRKFLDQKSMSYGSRTANVLALRFGLVPEGEELKIARALAGDVVDKHQGHFWTGIHGSRFLYTMLCNYGFDDMAYTVMTNASMPGHASDGKSVPDGLFSHPVQSGFAAWFHEGLGGIRPMDDVPGFKRVQLEPHGFLQLKSAKAWHNSMYGHIWSGWTSSDGRFEWKIVIPPNTTAVAYVPAKDAEQVEESGVLVGQSPGIKFMKYENGRAIYELDSGVYVFSSRL